MPLIRSSRIALPLENMPQMPATIRTHNLGTFHAKRLICMPRHRARDGVEKGRPAAAAFELVLGLVERGGASGARVDSWAGGGGEVFVVFAGVGGFCAFFAEDAELLCLIRRSVFLCGLK